MGDEHSNRSIRLAGTYASNEVPDVPAAIAVVAAWLRDEAHGCPGPALSRKRLQGLSGISNDMRKLQSNPDPRAMLAVDHFVYRIGLNAGMLAAALGGLDAFVFTAGIGENSPTIRARIAEQLAWLGVVLDPASNTDCKALISGPDSRVVLLVIPTDEELMIAQHTLALLPKRNAQGTAGERLAG